MQFIDTHTHINLQAFKTDATAVIQRSLIAGVGIINVGTQIDTSRQAVALLEQFPDDPVYAVIGLHPVHTWQHAYTDEEEVSFKTREEGFDSGLYSQLASNKKVIGIGECGLDYYRLPEDAAMQEEIKKKQRAAFQKQIMLAGELDLTLCIHCRPNGTSMDAYEEILEILKTARNSFPELRFEVHCYTGNAETAQKFIALGGYIGINGIITFDKTERSREVVMSIPLERIVLETDAPYLTPKPYRGQRNEPSYIRYVAEQVAEWKNIALTEVAQQTTQNAKKVFHIDF